MKLLSSFFLALLLIPAPQNAQPGSLAITHVTVIDTAGGPARTDMTVVVEGDRITQVAPAAGAKIPEGARTIDGAGKFVIPGLWDMHIHAFFGDWVPGGREVTLPLFIANGVTGVRDMGSDLEPILAARRDVEAGKLLGPRMIVSGPMLDGPKTQFPAALAMVTPEDGRRSGPRCSRAAASTSSRSSPTCRATPGSRSPTSAAGRRSSSRGTCPTPSAPPRPPPPARRVSST